ncbi:HlyD family secretion protein [Luteolibacter pohnpeiensis]|uniref:HlyD family secretion protein n=1 Tax=Luteolibacter pohnpeiensis TaxID=454153 RepID=A0A934S5G0_9BACT|nr:HlyD family secretion protein [Luteolibacter pohnpeiensis]MBK1882208.1 HlyD family secretion protein [Luteolibacter pohnpeiensis]
MTTKALTTPSDIPETDAPASKRSRTGIKVIAGIAALALAATAGNHFIRLSLFTESTDDAYISGHVHRVSANVAGPLLEVLADDNELVKKGQVLAKIDPREFDIMEKKAISSMEQAHAAELQAAAKAAEARAADLQAKAGISSAEAEIKGSEARLELAKITLNRNESLLGSDNPAVSQLVVDQNRSEVEASEAQLNASKANLEAAQATHESSQASIQAAEADIASAKAEIDVQKAAIDDIHRQLSYTEIIAPESGRVGAKNAENGNRVEVGQSLFALVEQDYWIVANFKETQLKKMTAGQKVDIEVDSLGGKHFSGTVDSIAPATGSQFAILPPDNATGNFTKVVQRVPVKITFDPESIRGFEDQLRPGLSTVVRVQTH